MLFCTRSRAKSVEKMPKFRDSTYSIMTSYLHDPVEVPFSTLLFFSLPCGFGRVLRPADQLPGNPGPVSASQESRPSHVRVAIYFLDGLGRLWRGHV